MPAVLDRPLPERPTPPAPAGKQPENRRSLLVVITAIALLAGGGWFALKMTAGPADPYPGAHGVNETVRTSFGYVTVAYVETIGGLTHQDLSGATHGIAGLVEAGSEQLQVTIEITSALPTETVAYSPEQFVLLTGSGKPAQDPATTTFHPGRLQPYASVSGHVGFVTPSDGGRRVLRFTDPAGNPVLIDLGRAGVASADSHHTASTK